MVLEEPVTVAFATLRSPAPRGRLRVSAARAVALVAVAAVVLEAAVGLLPDGPIFWVLTPVRLFIGIGLVALMLGRAGPGRPSLIGLAGLTLLVVSAAATVASGQDWSAWRGVLTQVAVLAAGVGRAWSTTPAPFGLLALVAAAVPAAVGVTQSVNRTPTGFCRAAANALADICGPDALVRAVGTFPNPNLLGAFLVLVLPVAAVGSASLADRGSRLVGSVVIVVGYAAVVLTGSRAAVLAALVGAAVVVLGSSRRGRRGRFALVGLAFALGVVVLAVASGGSAGVRSDVWAAAWHAVAEHPLGAGLGRAGAVITTAMPGGEAIGHAHNLWLNWAVEAGCPGLAAVTALTVAAVVTAVRAARRRSGATVAIVAGVAGFAAFSLVDDPANSSRIALALWTVLGLLAAHNDAVRERLPPTARGPR